MIRRHEAQVRVLVNDLGGAIRKPILEPRDHTTNHHVRPDVMALGPQGAEDIIDVAFCHHFADISHGSRLAQRRKQKITQYKQIANDTTNSRIVPIIIPVTGGWDKESFHCLRDIADAIAHRKHSPVAWSRATLFCRHASCLVASNARCLMAGAVY